MNKFNIRDPMKLSDIDGAVPAQIPGYTGSKPSQILSRTRGNNQIQLHF